MLLSLVDRGFSLKEVYSLSVKQVIFLHKVNSRYRDIKTLQEIQTGIAASGRQMDDLGFASFTNKLRYG